MALATRNLYLVLKARDEASRVIRGFGRELNRTGALARADQLRNQAAAAALSAAEMKMAGAAQADIDKQTLLAKTLRAQAQDLERQHRNTIRLTNALQSLSSTLVTVGSGFAILGAGVLVGLGATIKVAMDYQKQVALTMTQVTTFKTSLLELGQVGIDVANKIAVPFEDIQPALYDVFSSTNANLKESQILLEGFAKTAVAGQVSLQDAARGTIPILNAFNIPLNKVNDILDIQFQLVRKGVGTYGQFASVFGRVVPSATRANQSFQEVAAMLAYLTRNGLSAAMASASAARALDALSNPKAVSSMEKLGIKVRDLKGNLLPLQDVLTNLQKYLLKLPNKDRVGALVDLFKGAGGTIQARRFLDQVLLRPGELDEFKGFLNDMEHAQGAFGQAYGIMADTVAAKTQLIKNQLKVFEEFTGRTLQPVFVKLLGWVAMLFEKFNDLSPSTKRFIVIALAIGAALTTVAGAILVVLGLLAGLTAALISAGAAFFVVIGIISGVVVGIIAIGAAFIVAWQKSEQFRHAMIQIGKDLLAFYKRYIIPVAESIRDSFVKYVNPALRQFWDTIRTKVIPVAIDLYNKFKNDLKPIFDTLAHIIEKVFARAFQFIGMIIRDFIIPLVKQLTKLYEQHKAAINTVIKIFLIATAVLLGVAAATAALVAIITVLVVGGILLLLVGLFTALADIGHAVKVSIEFIVGAFKDLWDWADKVWHKLDDLLQKFQKFQTVTSAAQNAFKAVEGATAGKSAGSASSSAFKRVATSSANIVGPGSLLLNPFPKQSTSFNQYITIHTQDLNPVRTAAELGALLAGKF